MMTHLLPQSVNTSHQPCPVIAARIKWATADI
ncbi:hypothetical protein TFLX_03084 [Thermoflexales bacterium]|nr:hypothetical protein TFLX_03084 [Thermoflexales bacterium]